MASPHAELMALARSDDRYAFEAYEFLCHALSFTSEGVNGPPTEESAGDATIRHVSAEQLLEGVRRFALEQFGLMTPTVFREWGVATTADLGIMVKRLIEVGLWHRSPNDRFDCFEDGYDLGDGIVKDYELKLEDW